MEQANCIVRRANLDDVTILKGLWDIARLPSLDLERRFTEFQIVARKDGVILGAVGQCVVGNQGLIHSEAFYAPDQAEAHRALLWDRMHSLAKSRNLVRLWTRETGQFWRSAGFAPPTPDAFKSLPAMFGQPHGTWLTLKLAEESLLDAGLEREFELFQLRQAEATERLLRQAKVLKWIAGLIAVGFFAGAVLLLLRILGKSPAIRQ